MKTIAVIFGGQSTEHDVSIITALSSIIQPLSLTKKYKVEAVYISKSGAWYWGDEFKNIELYRHGKLDALLHKQQPASVQFDGGMTLIKASGLAGRKLSRRVDMVFPAMHGTYGEDGSLMGLLRMAGVPFVGCDITPSVIAMDKVLAKQIAETNDIPVTKYEYVYRDTLERDSQIVINGLEKSLSYPLFVKPAHLGSSIGITRAVDRASLQNALEVAGHYDEKIIVEEAVEHPIEVTLPIMGNRHDQLRVALLERPLKTAADFFDFDSKYLQEGKQKGSAKGAQGYSELPAQLDPALYKQAEAVATRAYRVLDCNGLARVDLLIDSQSKTVYFNEINPLPGDLYAHNWRAAGVSKVELVESLVQLAQNYWDNQRRKTTTFQTNYLQQF